MNWRFLSVLLLILGLCAGPALAQSDPFGTMDTIAIVASVVPDPGAGQYNLQLDLYVYSDEPLTGATMGFKWDNPKVVMDTAYASPAIKAGFDLGQFFYQDGNRALTNANRQFIFGGASLFQFFPADAGGRRLWASYLFSAPGWTVSDAVTFDTLTFSASSEYLLVEMNTNGDVKPVFNGAITIGNPPPDNQPPVLDPIGAKSVNENALLTFGVTATDPDVADVLTLNATNLPTGANFIDNGGGSGTFTWTPTFEQAGVYNVTFTVSDGEATDEEIVAITVANVNRPPVLNAIGPKAVDENVLLTFTVTASDPDGGAPTLSASNLPTGATFTPATGVFSWTPTFEQAGSYDVTFGATDGIASDNELVTITVNNVNRPPVLAAIGPQSVNEGVLLTINVTATDPDADAVLNMSATNIPVGGSFVDNGGGSATFTWTPTFDQAGVYNVTFAVGDGEAADDEIVTITVNDVATNTPPVLAEIGPQSTTVDVQLLFDVTATDADADPITLFANGLPTGASFIDHGDGSATFDWTPAAGQVGTHNVTFYANDGTVSDSEVVAITVNPAENQPPVLAAIGPQEIDENALLSFEVTATDPDGTTPSLNANFLPVGASFVDHGDGSATFSWTPTYLQAGVYIVNFVASDGLAADSEAVAISVFNVNRAPIFVTNAVDTTIDECGGVSFYFVAPDPDGDATSMFAEGIVGGMTFEVVDTFATFTFIPDTTMAGVYPVSVTATDGTDSTTLSFTITVENCIVPPACVHLILSDTVIQITDTVDAVTGPLGFRMVDIASDGNEACFTVSDTIPWLSAVPTTGCTPASVTVSYDATGLGAGTYWGFISIQGDSTVCAPGVYWTVVSLTLVDTASVPGGDADTVKVEIVNAAPGARADVPVYFKNECDLYTLNLMLAWTSEYLTLDSITTSTGRLSDFDWVTFIYNDSNFADLYADSGVEPMGYGELAVLHFTVAADAPEGFHEVTRYDISPNPRFVIDCGSGAIEVEPWFFSGGVMVEPAPTFTCGYVVDPQGDPIEGATVQLWSSFPGVGPEDSTASAVDGYFEFLDYSFGQFDLYAFKDGYYPGLVENVNWGETGIMITLTPLPEMTETFEWVNFYCGDNLYFGAPLPIGSVVDAYDPDGVRCGTWSVTVAGSYGFMPVYRDDPYSADVDEGAEPGDVIRLFINGIEAQTSGDNVWTEFGDTSLVCLEAGEYTRTVDLKTGWNLVSWSVDTPSDDIEDALASIAGHIVLILGFEQGGLTYDPNLPQFSTLWSVDHLSGYWIKVDGDVTLEVTGAPVSPSTPIPVTTGWNLVSYLPSFVLPIGDALQTIYADLLVALGFDSGGQVYLPGDDLHNSLLEFLPGHGYWVKVDAPGTLIYPSDAPIIFAQQRQPLGDALHKAASDVAATTQWLNLYARNLTVDGQAVPAGALVEAFTLDGLKIGSAAVKADGMFGFMPVYADDMNSETVDGVRLGERFTLAVNGTAVEETFAFTGHGEQVELHNLTAKAGEEPVLPASYSLRQNYPNPFNPTTTIEFSLPSAGKATIEIFNVLGELVATPFDGMAQSGANVVVWDGARVASGIYFYRLTADNYTETKKMTLMK